MMDDVSVLLNLTGKVVFERTNPLMDLVGGHGPLLFYDRLSLERFPLAPEEQEGHVQKLLVDMGNLLEARRLSADDSGGKIRILVMLDLVGGFSHRRDLPRCFPAQKARLFLKRLRDVFDKDSQLLDRFCFTFIFLECDSFGSQENDFYRSLACDGYHGKQDGWLSAEMLSVNVLREQMLAGLDSPDEDLLLTDKSIAGQYACFSEGLKLRTAQVADLLDQAGQGQTFRQGIEDACRDLKTMGDLQNLDFDHLFRLQVSECIGLRCTALDDCSSFLFKLRTGTAAQRKRDEMVLASLLQLLVTRPSPWPAAFHVVDGKAHEHSLNVEALARLQAAVAKCLPKLRSDGALRWAEDREFAYVEYSARNADPMEKDTYSGVNDEVDQQRNSQYEEFCRQRRVPFFFGGRPGDWRWYTEAAELLDRIYAFEAENDRPLHDSQRRITDREMNSKPREASYAKLKVMRDRLLEDQQPVNPMEDLKTYLKERTAVMADFATLKERVKNEMVKLGFALNTFLISLLAVLLITLCYAFHFFLPSATDGLVWIAVALGAACLVSALAAIVAQSRVKKAITKAFDRVDDCLVRLRTGQEAYVNTVNKRISTQNDADIRRKNLQELESKIAEFDRHNMQVELWEKHFSAMERKLREMQEYVGVNAPSMAGGNQPSPITIHDDDLDIEGKPGIPVAISQEFQSMQTTFSSGQHIDNVTCFLQHLEVTSFDSHNHLGI